MKSTLFLSYDGMTDPLGQSQVLPYLVGLSKNGYKIHLVSFEKEALFLKHREYIETLCKAAGISWHPTLYTKKPPIISTIKDVKKMQHIALKIYKEHDIKLVHCRSYIAAIVGLKLQKLGVKLIFDMRGFWADERVDGNIWNLKNPLFRIIFNYFKKLEKKALIKSDAVISLTHVGKKELLSWKLEELNPEKITVIPCCVDLVKFNPEKIKENQKKTLKTSLDIDNQYVLGYVGSIGTWYLLQEMLVTFKSILTKKPNSIFLFITKDSKNDILKMVKKMGVSESKFRFASVLHHEIPSFISLFDASIFYIKPSYSKKASSPTKQGELMAMGIPIICNAGVGDTDKILLDFKGGQLVKDISFTFLEKFEIDFSSFNQATSLKGAHDYFSLEKGVLKYSELYQNLLAK